MQTLYTLAAIARAGGWDRRKVNVWHGRGKLPEADYTEAGGTQQFWAPETIEPWIKQQLADERQESAAPADLQDRIRAAYAKIIRRRRRQHDSGWVPMLQLRAELADVPRAVLDAELDRMIEQPDVWLMAELNQKVLTDQDWQAAVTIGGEPRHLLRIGD